MAIFVVLLFLAGFVGLVGLAVKVSLSAASPSLLDGAVNGVLGVNGGGVFVGEIVGESHYQEILSAIAGGKTEEGAHHSCTARIIAEPDNAFDANAHGVWIEGRKVGHLSRAAALALSGQQRRVTAGPVVIECPALIVGGWKRARSEGHFGVQLDLPVGLLDD